MKQRVARKDLEGISVVDNGMRGNRAVSVMFP